METNEGAVLGWQPIETAPKSREYLLVWDTHYNVPRIARTASDGTVWIGDWDHEVKASHWAYVAPPSAPSVTPLTEFDQ